MTRKMVLITGSSSGIGRVTAQWFAERGWNVAATARDPAALAEWARCPSLAALKLDVTDEATITAAVVATLEPFASAYDSTKYAIEGLSESLRFELKAHGIRVKLIEPGHFKTDFINRSLVLARHSAYDIQLDNWMAWVTRGDEDAPRPEEVAAMVFRAANDPSVLESASR